MDSVTEFIDIFQFAEIAYSTDEVVEADEGYAEDSCFSSHGLRVTDIERSKRHDVVHVERVDLNTVLLKLRFKGTFGSNIDPSMRRKNIDEALRNLRVDAFDAGVVVGIEGREAYDEIGFGGIDAVGFDNLRIGSKMIRMEICQFVIQWKLSKRYIETLLCSPQICVCQKIVVSLQRISK